MEGGQGRGDVKVAVTPARGRAIPGRIDLDPEKMKV